MEKSLLDFLDDMKYEESIPLYIRSVDNKDMFGKRETNNILKAWDAFIGRLSSFVEEELHIKNFNKTELEDVVPLPDEYPLFTLLLEEDWVDKWIEKHSKFEIGWATIYDNPKNLETECYTATVSRHEIIDKIRSLKRISSNKKNELFDFYVRYIGNIHGYV